MYCVSNPQSLEFVNISLISYFVAWAVGGSVVVPGSGYGEWKELWRAGSSSGGGCG